MKILMMVNTDVEKDQRVKNCFNELSKNNDVTLISVNTKSQNTSVINISLGQGKLSRFNDFNKKVYSLTKKRNYDLIYVHDFYCCKVGFKIAKRKRCKLIYDAHELYIPVMSHFSLRDRFFFHYEKRAINNSDLIVCANRERALVMLGFYRLKAIPTVVSNKRLDVYNVEKRESINNILRFVYCGNLNSDRNIIRFIRDLSTIKSFSIKFDIYGTGELFSFIEEMKNKPEYSFVDLKGLFNNGQINSIMENYDVGFLSYDNSSINNILCCPNKLFDYIANGIPVFSYYNFNLGDVINGNGLGVCSDDLNKAITYIINHYSMMSESCLNYVKKCKQIGDDYSLVSKIIQNEVWQ